MRSVGPGAVPAPIELWRLAGSWLEVDAMDGNSIISIISAIVVTYIVLRVLRLVEPLSSRHAVGSPIHRHSRLLV